MTEQPGDFGKWCPDCGEMRGICRCEDEGAGNDDFPWDMDYDDNDDEHTGFWVNIDGESFHVLGDPNMSDETVQALGKIVEVARRMMEGRNNDNGTKRD